MISVFIPGLNIVPSEEAIKTGSYALQDDIDAGRLAKSEIIEKDGQKFGYIGLVPSDMRARLSQQSQDFAKDMKVLDLKETEAALQKEVRNRSSTAKRSKQTGSSRSKQNNSYFSYGLGCR